MERWQGPVGMPGGAGTGGRVPRRRGSGCPQYRELLPAAAKWPRGQPATPAGCLGTRAAQAEACNTRNTGWQCETNTGSAEACLDGFKHVDDVVQAAARHAQRLGHVVEHQHVGRAVGLQAGRRAVERGGGVGENRVSPSVAMHHLHICTLLKRHPLRGFPQVWSNNSPISGEWGGERRVIRCSRPAGPPAVQSKHRAPARQRTLMWPNCCWKRSHRSVSSLFWGASVVVGVREAPAGGGGGGKGKGGRLFKGQHKNAAARSKQRKTGARNDAAASSTSLCCRHEQQAGLDAGQAATAGSPAPAARPLCALAVRPPADLAARLLLPGSNSSSDAEPSSSEAR